MSTNTETLTLTLTHIFNADRERVWNAWTNPMAVSQWHKPGPEMSPVVHTWEPKVGGRYRLAFVSTKEEAVHAVHGEFREFAKPERLAYTWNWSDGEMPETLVELTFKSVGERTELTLVHSGFPNADARDHHNQGWSGIYESLEKHLANGAPGTRLIDTFIPELKQEAMSTRRVLERVPENKLDWRPHPKAMSLGQLALHVATTPGGVSNFLKLTDPIPVPDFKQEAGTSRDEILAAHEKSIADALRNLEQAGDETVINGMLRVQREGKDVFALPFPALLRVIMLNHWYHHRGQLTTYLRTLDVELPSVYGPSADELPF